MIRLYAYYSCGGYKDMYLGSSDTAASPSYFLPLLPVMKKRGRTDEVEKIKSPKKNAYGNESTINNLTDLSNTEWHQNGNLAKDFEYSFYLNSNSNTQVKVCDITNYNNIVL